MFQIIRRILLVVLCLLPASAALGQFAGSVPNLAIELTPKAFYDFENEAYYGQFMYSRIASALQIDPDASGTGLARTAILSAGVRSTDLERYDFRWRVGVIDMDLIRTPLSMGLTLVDYDKSGFLELDVKWVNLRLGPSIYLGNDRSHFALRAVGIGGLTTLRLGEFAYSGLGLTEEVNNKKRSYEIGYLGEMRVLIANVFSLEASYRFRNQLGGLRPNIVQLNGFLGLRFSDTISVAGTYLIEETTAGTNKITRQGIGARLSLVY